MTGVEDVDPLGLYFGNYLHEDWMYEFETWQAAFEELLTLPSAIGLQRLVQQIDALLALDSRQLDVEMRRRNPGLNPPHDLQVSDQEWLASLRDRAAAELVARTEAGA